MHMFIIAAMVILGVLYYFSNTRDVIRIEWTRIGAFLGFLAVVTCCRIALLDYIAYNDPNFSPLSNSVILGVPVHQFITVFWEDVMFGLPIYFIMEKVRWNGLVKFALILLISLTFGYGHAYQGAFAIAITSLYPFLVSYRYGKKYGFGTVMLCHIIYDFSIFYFIKFLPFLL